MDKSGKPSRSSEQELSGYVKGSVDNIPVFHLSLQEIERWSSTHAILESGLGCRKQLGNIVCSGGVEFQNFSLPHGEKGTHMYCQWECKLYNHYGKQYGKKLIIEFPYDPAIPLLGIYPEKINSRRYKHSRVQSSIIYNSQGMKTTSASINRWLD